MLHKIYGGKAENRMNAGFLAMRGGLFDYKKVIKKQTKCAIVFCNSFFYTYFYERLDNWRCMRRVCY